MSRLHSNTTKPSLSSATSASGVLAGCLITLAGVVCGVSPDIILTRTLIGTLLVMGMAYGMSLCLRHMLPASEEES